MEEAGQRRPPDAQVPNRAGVAEPADHFRVMELRSGRRLRRSPPPPHRVRSRRGPGGGADRLSDLPDDMLLLVLASLRCARSAARTGVLSRRWRGLWTRLPDLTFRDVAPAQIEAVLAGLAASPWVSNALDIEISPSHCLDEARLSSLLHAAARFSPQQLLFSYQDDRYMEVDLPCFQRATVIKISSYDDICLTPLPAGEFPAVEILSLDGCSVIDLGTLVTLCPRLRVLRVTASTSDIVVHSGSLQMLVLSTDVVYRSINIVTPRLKHLEMDIEAGTDLSVSVSAPMVEEIEWERFFTELALVFGFWRLESIRVFRPTDRYTDSYYWRKEDTCSQLRPVHALHLDLSIPDEFDDVEIVEIVHEMEKLPVTDFSVLKLILDTPGHVFGALVLRLFGLHQICAVTKRLIIVMPLSHKERQACPENCPCDEPKNWRCQSISLTRLEEVQIDSFTGEDHEHDLLKLIFRSSPILNRVTLKLVPGFGGCIKEIYDIFLANPSVKVCVYASDGGLVRQLSDQHAP